MAAYPVDDSQRRAAKVIGTSYLLAMAAANFAVLYVNRRLIVSGDAMATARNIMARAYDNLEHYEEANRLATEALKIEEGIGDNALVATSLENIALQRPNGSNRSGRRIAPASCSRKSRPFFGVSCGANWKCRDIRCWKRRPSKRR